tara:strand:+ start:584 stop:880 length:297 start_codon:yes stop_codon:yes gene_type:complete
MGPFIRGFLSSSLLFLVLIFIFGMSPGRKNKKKNISKRNFELIKSNRDDIKLILKNIEDMNIALERVAKATANHQIRLDSLYKENSFIIKTIEPFKPH